MKTPNEIAGELLTVSDTLRLVLDELKELDGQLAEATRIHEIAKARVYIATEGAVEHKKQVALIECEHERTELDLAQVRQKSCVEYVRFLRTKIDVLRTVSATVRDEWKATA